jgi:phage tail sheath protein FI
VIGVGAPPRPAPLSAYRTPGVRLEWLDAGPQDSGAVRTDVAGLVGIAERGPLHKAVRVESVEQYAGVFGGRPAEAFLPYAVEGFFGNGGRACWVVRVANPVTARAATASLGFLTLTATSPGRWGNGIGVSTRPDPLVRGRFTLTVRQGAVTEVWRGLTRDAADPRDAVRLLTAPGGSRLVVPAWPAQPAPPVAAELTLAGGEDGYDGLRPRHFAGSFAPSEDPWGLAALQAVDELTMVCVPDVWTPPRRTPGTPRPRPAPCEVICPPEVPPPPPPPATQQRPVFSAADVAGLHQAILAHCEGRADRIALLDAPPGTPPEVLAWRAGLNSSYGALYHPWIRLPDNGIDVPPSGHVAGIAARVPVHKPPAGELVRLAVDTSRPVDAVQHGDLNDAGVNVLRVTQQGVQLLGARTLSTLPEWRYLNVRRLLLMIERAVAQGTAWTVFEPNGPALWAEFTRVVRGVLDGVWRAGMLDGVTAAQAYSVVCDARVNPPEQVASGELVCLIGVRPPQPAEFVVIRIVRTATGVGPGG